MNKKAITKTAVCYWSEEDDCYVVKSALSDRIIGIGNTQGEAWEVFLRHLDTVYMAYLEGQLAAHEKRGRPSKGLVALNISVKPHTKENIVHLSEDFEASQGEVVDYLFFYHTIMRTQNLQQHQPSEPFELAETLGDTAEDVQNISDHMHNENCSCKDLEWTPEKLEKAFEERKKKERDR